MSIAQHSKNVRIQESIHGHCGIGRKYLVTGFGKRAINVIVRPFLGAYADDQMLAWHAALEASKLGWKTVYVIPDYFEGDTAYIVNPHGFHQYDEHQCARYLCPCDYDGDQAYKQFVQADSEGK